MPIYYIHFFIHIQNRYIMTTTPGHKLYLKTATSLSNYRNLPWICLVLLLLTSSMVAGQSAKGSGQFIFDKAPFKSCHASTLALTPQGPVAAWFAGTEEKNPDVEIWFSRQVKGKWSTPVSVANGIQPGGNRFPCWNPVLFQYPNGALLLFYKVGADPVEWWGEVKRSYDQGRTWSAAERLPEGILGPVKNKPVLLADGRLVCPSSTENKEDGRWQIHLEITTDEARTWTKTGPLNDGRQFHLIQPSLLQYSGDSLQLLCRSMENRVVSLWSVNGGKTWSAPGTLSLHNPNSGTDAVTLGNGLQVLVYNPTERYEGKWGGPRYPLSVAVSRDGKTWQHVKDLETLPGEYSYPAIIEGASGEVLISYTWKREKVRVWKLRIRP